MEYSQTWRNQELQIGGTKCMIMKSERRQWRWHKFSKSCDSKKKKPFSLINFKNRRVTGGIFTKEKYTFNLQIIYNLINRYILKLNQIQVVQLEYNISVNDFRMNALTCVGIMTYKCKHEFHIFFFSNLLLLFTQFVLLNAQIVLHNIILILNNKTKKNCNFTQ